MSIDLKLKRKNYVLEIFLNKNFLFFSYQKKVVLRYQQATVFETLEAISNKEKMIDFLTVFIDKHSETKLTFTEISGIIKKHKKIISAIYDTYFGGGLKSSGTEEGEVTNMEISCASFIDLACKELHIEPNKLLHEYTMEQVNYLLEGVIRNKNEQTEKGRKQNQMKLLQMKLENRSEEDRKRDEEFFSS